MEDETRTATMLAKEGFRDCRTWRWGPFTVVIGETPRAEAFVIAIEILGYCFNIGIMRAV